LTFVKTTHLGDVFRLLHDVFRRLAD